ncbi:MAG: hypothetical protein HZA50_01660 [Planctomycetes bacterium]|nr:hypothetical protein [Planctomycetota bacterium]
MEDHIKIRAIFPARNFSSTVRCGIFIAQGAAKSAVADVAKPWEQIAIHQFLFDPAAGGIGGISECLGRGFWVSYSSALDDEVIFPMAIEMTRQKYWPEWSGIPALLPWRERTLETFELRLIPGFRSSSFAKASEDFAHPGLPIFRTYGAENMFSSTVARMEI